jgi:2-dehydropantoate 2-reductase
MHQDLERGNRMELPWLSGGVSGLGVQLNISTPKNDAITDILTLHAAGK